MTDLIPKIFIEAVAIIENNTPFSDARFSADGLTVLTKCKTDYCRWDAKTGGRLGAPELNDPHVSAFAPQAGEEFGCDALDERTTQAVANHFNGWADLVAVSPNGRYVAVGSNSGYLGVFDLERDTPLVLHGHTTSMNNHMQQNSINTMLFDSSSTYLISMADEDDAPLLWDLSARGEDRIWNGEKALSLKPSIELNKVTPAGIDTIHFSSTAPQFVTTHRASKTAMIWEITSQL